MKNTNTCCFEKHEYLEILDCPVYYLSTSIRCDWFPCQAKWELYQMGTLPYKINGNPTGKEGILRAASSDAARCYILESLKSVLVN